MSFSCQACLSDQLTEIPAFSQLPRVTSDSKPFPAGGRLTVCRACGLAQKLPDPQWLAEIAEIYKNYEMYHQSNADDQVIFDPVSGRPAGRCAVVVRRLLECGRLPSTGLLLDVGAGTGAMLAAFSGVNHNWRLFGLDLDNRKEAYLRKIPRFERLFTSRPDEFTKRFDLLTLIHSLEHFPSPTGMLRDIKGLIASGGHLFVQVNNVESMQFDLIVADHLSHFSPKSLTRLIGEAGFAVDTIRTDWVKKEISLLATPGVSQGVSTSNDADLALAHIEREVAWLAGTLEHARATLRQADTGPFGVFGTSIAATWLASALGQAIDFYVDEDPARIGLKHLGRPIITPGEVPAGATVYLAFISDVAKMIASRLSHLPIRFVAPGTEP